MYSEATLLAEPPVTTQKDQLRLCIDILQENQLNKINIHDRKAVMAAHAAATKATEAAKTLGELGHPEAIEPLTQYFHSLQTGYWDGVIADSLVAATSALMDLTVIHKQLTSEELAQILAPRIAQIHNPDIGLLNLHLGYKILTKIGAKPDSKHLPTLDLFINTDNKDLQEQAKTLRQRASAQLTPTLT